jgi:acyl carrier protein
MTTALRDVVLEEIGNLAPEADLAAVDGTRDLREQLDLDSMDFLNLVIALHQRLGVDIPEADYAELVTLDGALRYLARKTGG